MADSNQNESNGGSVFSVTGVKPGTTEITLTAGTVTRTIPVTVPEPEAPTSIRVMPAGTLTLETGQKQPLTINVLPDGALQDVTVTSDHPDIVSVENDGGFSLTGVKAGGASITVASAGTPTVTTILPVVVPQPITVTKLEPAAGVTVDTSVPGDFNGGVLKLDATNGAIKQALPVKSVEIPAGWTAVMHVNRDYATSNQLLRMLDNRGMPISSYGANTSAGATPGDNTIVMRGITRLNMGIIQLTGGTATVSRLSLRPHVKGELIISHDVAPSQAVQKLLPVYREHGNLPASFRITAYGNWTVQTEVDAARQLTDAGWEYGVYSLVDGEPDDYDTGDWTKVANTLWNTRILGLKPSLVCSHNHKYGDAYARAMRAAGFPVVRGANLGMGVTVNYTPSHGLLHVCALNALWDANSQKVTDTIAGITEAAEHGVTFGLFTHAALPDGDTSDGTAVSQSVLAKILDAVKQLVDAGKLDVITPSEWVRRHAPDVYQQWADAE